MTDSDITQGPKSDRKDVLLTLTRAGLSTVPFAGGPIVELLDLVVIPSIERRREEWIAEIAGRLKALESRVDGIRLEDLAGNEAFVTTFLQASQIAMRNHQQEKLKALRNAVLNSGLPNAPDDDLQQMFLNYIDTLTSWHLRMLAFMHDLNDHAEKYSKENPGWDWDEPETILYAVYPQLRNRQDFHNLVTRDLASRGLADRDNLKITVMMTLHGRKQVFVSRTTALGSEFLAFISTPVEDEN